ncbi:hypothetical protein AB0D60_37060, partial [Streptomyces sp. NPDC048306]
MFAQDGALPAVASPADVWLLARQQLAPLHRSTHELALALGRVLKVVHDGVDRVPIERSLVVDPVLKHAL